MGLTAENLAEEFDISRCMKKRKKIDIFS